jgi:hypothetical protein
MGNLRPNVPQTLLFAASTLMSTPFRPHPAPKIHPKLQFRSVIPQLPYNPFRNPAAKWWGGRPRPRPDPVVGLLPHPNRSTN